MQDDLVAPLQYDHAENSQFHTVAGALETLRRVFPQDFPRTVLDLGCGTGTWLRASLECGATEITGVDSADLPQKMMFVPKHSVHQADLNLPLDLERRFDLVICLETVEHLDPKSAETVVETLTRHGDRILFSAATPGQPGTHHVNCQWPDYWQRLFNSRGYACDDWVRWAIWCNSGIEPWYRQNLMLVTRDAAASGNEARVRPVLHPALFTNYASTFMNENLRIIEEGGLPFSWYLTTPFRSAARKLARYLERRR